MQTDALRCYFARVYCLILLYVVTFKGTVVNSDLFQVSDFAQVKFINGSDMCATQQPSQIQPTRSKVDCARACLTLGPACSRANYRTRGLKCELFSPGDSLLFEVQVDCVHLKLMSDVGITSQPTFPAAVSSSYTTRTVSLGQSRTTTDVTSASSLGISSTPIVSSMTTLNPSTDFKRTVIFHRLVTWVGQDMFLRGGLDSSRRQGCTSLASTSACAITISANSFGVAPFYDKYNAWRVNDTRLDWYGAEPYQGAHLGIMASGTPAAWTSNKTTDPGYQPDNIWDDNYWKVDLLMNCSQTESGWFEFKGFATPSLGWEGNVNQASCTGTAGGTRPYASTNHFARCGFQNVFSWGSSTCMINTLI